jgi:peptidoglycan/LPS O-acetylase OafA/YrhL
MQSSATPSIKAPYRADIDGLRAIAVLLVIFNHVGIQRVPGGFIGVDVFFVISGYLIGSHMLGEMDAGRFSIGRFYERRVRRIFPALLMMLLLCSPLIYLFFFPSEHYSFGLTERAALFSISNVYLSHQPSYFSPAVRTNPFLHTWSLGVEEQFYLAFPLLLLVLTRWARRYLTIILWCLTIPLFLVACSWTRSDPIAAFYLSPLRAWEFLLGVLPAAAALPALRQSWLRNMASAVGLLLILWAGLFYRDTMPFPGWGALAPCLGAMFVIMAGQFGDSITGGLLAWGPLRFIGLISYSLYLWHWPIQIGQVAENFLVPDRNPAWEAKLAVIAASLVTGTLSWRFVEQPFRTGIFRLSKLWLFGITGVMFAIVLEFSSLGIRGHGMAIRSFSPPQAYRDMMRAGPTAREVPWSTCLTEPEEFPALFRPDECLKEDPTRPHVLLLGDSHAGAMYWGLKNTFPELNISLFAVTRSTPTLIGRNPPGQRYSDALFKDYIPKHKIDTVILVSRWVREDADFHMADTIEWLRKRHIKTVVVGPSVEFDASLVRLIELSNREHDPALPGRHLDQAAKDLDDYMRSLAKTQWHVPYISMYDDLCQPDVVQGGLNARGCPVFAAPGVALLWDTDHFSPTGSMKFAEIIRARHQLPVAGD